MYIITFRNKFVFIINFTIDLHMTIYNFPIISALAAAIITVEVDISVTVAPPGEEITVLCRMMGGTSSTQLYIYKEVRLHDGTEIKVKTLIIYPYMVFD